MHSHPKNSDSISASSSDMSILSTGSELATIESSTKNETMNSLFSYYKLVIEKRYICSSCHSPTRVGFFYLIFSQYQIYYLYIHRNTISMTGLQSKTSKSSPTLSFSTRVDRELYETFHTVAREQGTNASVLIRQFMQGYSRGKITQSFDPEEAEFDALFAQPAVQSKTRELFSTLRSV